MHLQTVNTQSQHSFSYMGSTPITMTSLELVEFINIFRRAQAERAGVEFPSKGYAELQHSDFMKKVPEVLGLGGVRNFSDTYLHPQNGQEYHCYRFPKREACLMAMSYSYELQAAVFDRMTALEEQARGPNLPDFSSPAVAARAWAEQYERRQIAESQRDDAIRTKAQIGSTREATSMATASTATRKVYALEDELGRGRNYRQVKAIEWLREEFDLSMPGAYSQIGKKLSELSMRMDRPAHLVPDEKYPNGVKAYHIDVIDTFRGMLRTDRNMLAKFRKW